MENEQPEFASKFKRGDVVRLNSGGPAMTVVVEPANEEGTATCQWFPSSNINTLEERVHPDCLTLVPATEDTESGRPTAPKGYEPMLGKNIAVAPVGTLVWYYSNSTWGEALKEARSGQELSPYAWFAIPKLP